jgi:hypothetical protein
MDRGRSIFEWLNFETVQKFVMNKNEPYKRWTLLNLSIWIGEKYGY